MYCVWGGEAFVDVRDWADCWVRVRLQPGDVVLIPPNRFHRATPKSPGARLVQVRVKVGLYRSVMTKIKITPGTTVLKFARYTKSQSPCELRNLGGTHIDGQIDSETHTLIRHGIVVTM